MNNLETKLEAIAKGSDSDYEVLDPGVYPALCTQIIYCGLVPGSEQYPQPQNETRRFRACKDIP